MKFPLHDWQFWVVTALAGLALWWILRSLLPRLGRRKTARRATLTIEGAPAPARRRTRR